MAEWSAEQAVTASELAELIGTGPVRLMAEGWDNAVFAADGWLYRLPRRAIAVPGVQTECLVLPRLADRLPVPVPLPEAVALPPAAFPWPAMRYRPLPGREAARADLTDAQRRALAAPLGRFLRALHAPALAEELGPLLPPDTFRRADMGHRVPRTLEALRALGPSLDPATHAQLAVLLGEAEGLPGQARAVVHGDLHARHLLVDEAGGLSGVIDWGDLHYGDPAVDLQVYWSLLTPEARPALLEAYGPVDRRTLLVARVVAILIATALARSAEDFGLPEVERDALRALRAIAAAPDLP